MALVQNVEYKEITVDELPATSSVLVGGAHHLGKYCFEDFKSYMQKRYDLKDPRATLEEGKAVTRCALQFFTLVKENCNKEFTDYWNCLDYNNQEFGRCRKTQKMYDSCMLAKLNLQTEQPTHLEVKE